MSNHVSIDGAGEVLRNCRLEAELSLEQLADRLQWDKGRLSKYENNRLGVTLDVIEQIAVALGHRAEPIVLKCVQHLYPALASNRSRVGRLLQSAVDHMLKE